MGAPLDLEQFDGFTPGPWWLDDDGFIAAGSQETYCTVAEPRCMEPRGNESEIDANASLIAAAPALLAECVRLRAEYESMRLAGRELAADLDAAESLIYDAYENIADEDELREAIRERREEKAELATYLKNLPEVTEAKHE